MTDPAAGDEVALPARPGRLALWAVGGSPLSWIGFAASGIAVAAAELAIPWLLQLAVDAAIDRHDAARLDRVGLAMLGVIAGLYLAHAAMLRLEAGLLQRAIFRLRHALYARILTQPLSFFSRVRTGDLMHRVVNDTDTLETHAVYLFSDLPFELVTVLGVLTVMLVIEPSLALVVVAFLGLATIISARLGRPLPTLRKLAQAAMSGLNARLQEVFSGIRTVKVFAREAHEIERLDDANREILRLETRNGTVEALLDPVFDLMELLGIVFIVWYGAHLIIEERLTPGGLVAFMAYMELLAGPIGHVGKYYRHFVQCRAVMERLAEFIGGLSPSPRGRGRADIAKAAPAIAFKGVAFAFPDAPRRVLDGVDLEVAAGERIGVLGRNASGKSTLMDLLLGFHAPDAGQILVDGVPLADLDRRAWLDAVGTMSQEVVLFHATVAANIAYGRPSASADEVKDAAAAAGLESLLKRLPLGLDSVVGDRGSKLSGGERQRVALARLFLKDPRVLILDEPMAHLDGEALREVVGLLDRLSRGRTTFVIEHRLEALGFTDRAVLLESGLVARRGSAEALATSLLRQMNKH